MVNRQGERQYTIEVSCIMVCIRMLCIFEFPQENNNNHIYFQQNACIVSEVTALYYGAIIIDILTEDIVVQSVMPACISTLSEMCTNIILWYILSTTHAAQQ